MKTSTATKSPKRSAKTPAVIACDCCAKRKGDWDPSTFCNDCNETSYADNAEGNLNEAVRHVAIAKDLQDDPKRRRALVLLARTAIAAALFDLERVELAPPEDARTERIRYWDTHEDDAKGGA